MQLLAKLSLFFNKTFALWVIVVGALAYAFPSTFKPLGAYIAPLLGIVMFGMGLTLTASDFREVVRQPRDVIIGILSQFLIMPIVAYLLCLVMHLPPEIAVGVILVGCCPGGTASNVMTFLARGDLPLSVTITSCTTLLAPVVTPFLIWVFAKQWVDISPVAMFVSIVEIVLLPIALGVVVHTVLGKKVEGFAAAMPLISVVAIALIVAAVVAATALSARSFSWLSCFITVLAISSVIGPRSSLVSTLPSVSASLLKWVCRIPALVLLLLPLTSPLCRWLPCRPRCSPSGITFPVRSLQRSSTAGTRKVKRKRSSIKLRNRKPADTVFQL